MFNPFKKRYKIVEHSNQLGEKCYDAIYASVIGECLRELFCVYIYIDPDGDMQFSNHLGSSADHKSSEYYV